MYLRIFPENSRRESKSSGKLPETNRFPSSVDTYDTYCNFAPGFHGFHVKSQRSKVQDLFVIPVLEGIELNIDCNGRSHLHDSRVDC